MMKTAKRKSFVLAAISAAGFLLGTAGQSQASIILTSESQLSATDQVLSAPGPDGTFFTDANPLNIDYNGGTASFKGPFADFVQRRTQIDSSGGNNFTFNGDFAPGDPLFFTTFAPGPLELRFSSDVTEVGTQFQSTLAGPFTASISSFDANNNLIGTFTADGATKRASDNSAVFLGLRNTAGDPAIRRVLFGTTNDAFGFYTNQISFNAPAAPAPVPEPSTYAMFGLGILSIVALQRRKRKSSPHSAPVLNGAAC